jgi:hypothetical protein
MEHLIRRGISPENAHGKNRLDRGIAKALFLILLAVSKTRDGQPYSQVWLIV